MLAPGYTRWGIFGYQSDTLEKKRMVLDPGTVDDVYLVSSKRYRAMLFVVCNVSDTKCSGRSLRTSLTFNITNWPKALLDAGGILALGSYYRWVKARHLSPPPFFEKRIPGIVLSDFRTFETSIGCGKMRKHPLCAYCISKQRSERGSWL